MLHLSVDESSSKGGGKWREELSGELYPKAVDPKKVEERVCEHLAVKEEVVSNRW